MVHKKMKKKGWTDKELSHLEKTLKKETKRDYLMKKNLHNFYYFTNTIIIILLNFAGVFLISPILLFMESFWVYLFTGIFSLCIGAMLNYLSLSMSHLELKHHLISFGIIPFIVIIDWFIFREYINFLQDIFKTYIVVNVTTICLVFVCFLLLPYLFSIRQRLNI